LSLETSRAELEFPLGSLRISKLLAMDRKMGEKGKSPLSAWIYGLRPTLERLAKKTQETGTEIVCAW